MKLYFKDLSYKTKYKWLEWFASDNHSRGVDIFKYCNDFFNEGYVDINNFSVKEIDQLKALDIWKEPRKFGRFWNLLRNTCDYGLLLREEDDCFVMTNEEMTKWSRYKFFEEITDFEEIRRY